MSDVIVTKSLNFPGIFYVQFNRPVTLKILYNPIIHLSLLYICEYTKARITNSNLTTPKSLHNVIKIYKLRMQLEIIMRTAVSACISSSPTGLSFVRSKSAKSLLFPLNSHMRGFFPSLAGLGLFL